MRNELALKRVLRDQGRSQRWFARRVGIEETRLSKILLGERPAPRWFVEAACAVLGLPEAELFAFAHDVPNGTDLVTSGTTATGGER